MAYVVFIVREEGEITRAELEAVPGLELQEGLSATNPRTGEVMTMDGTYGTWNDLRFSFNRGRVDVARADDDSIARMRELADTEGALFLVAKPFTADSFRDVLEPVLA